MASADSHTSHSVSGCGSCHCYSIVQFVLLFFSLIKIILKVMYNLNQLNSIAFNIDYTIFIIF